MTRSRHCVIRNNHLHACTVVLGTKIVVELCLKRVDKETGEDRQTECDASRFERECSNT